MDSTHVVLEKSHRSLRPGSRALGPANPDESIEVTVKVRRANALPKIATRPPLMDRAKLVDRHGAGKADLEEVAHAFAPYCLHVVGQNAAARSVRLAGTTAAMEKAFN